MGYRRLGCLVLALFGSACTRTPPAASPGWSASRLQWGGHTWERRQSHALDGAGPNRWSEDGVKVQPDGSLSLTLKPQGSHWYAAEVRTDLPDGYVDVKVRLEGPLGRLDPNVVVGAFVYRRDSSELDVELAQWGVPHADRAQFVVAPALPASRIQRFALPAQLQWLDAGIFWRPNAVAFKMLGAGVQRSWRYEGTPRPWPDHHALHINLWLHRGRAPTNGRPVTVRLTRLHIQRSAG